MKQFLFEKHSIVVLSIQVGHGEMKFKEKFSLKTDFSIETKFNQQELSKQLYESP